MALKDWRKIDKNLWENKETDDRLFVISYREEVYVRLEGMEQTIEGLAPFITTLGSFKSKQGALNFVKRYMRKH